MIFHNIFSSFYFFFNDTATTEIYTLSLHDALPIATFRGFVDLVLRRVIPWPSLFGTDDPRLREEDVVNRRRAAFWGFIWKLVRLFLIIVLIVVIFRSFVHGWEAANPWATTQDVGS